MPAKQYTHLPQPGETPAPAVPLPTRQPALTRQRESGAALPLAHYQAGAGGGLLSPGGLRRLQQTAGNRATHQLIQRLAAPAAPAPRSDLGAQVRAQAGRGRPLPAAVQARLEAGLSADLAAVRVHTDAEADRLAQGVGAVAFTTGADIFFRQGAYDPQAPAGLRTLAHEAAHTIQQATGQAARPAGGAVAVSPTDHPLERIAEQAAARVVAGSASLVATPRITPLPAAASGQAGLIQRRVGPGLQADERVTWINPPQELLDSGKGPKRWKSTTVDVTIKRAFVGGYVVNHNGLEYQASYADLDYLSNETYHGAAKKRKKALEREDTHREQALTTLLPIVAEVMTERMKKQENDVPMEDIKTPIQGAVALGNLLTIHQGTQHPYTQNMGLAPQSLPQTYVFSVGAYKPKPKKEGGRRRRPKARQDIGKPKAVTSEKRPVSYFLQEATKWLKSAGLEAGAIATLLHQLVTAPSHEEFKKLLETFNQQVKDHIQENLDRPLWGLVQLWNLEAARRRSGGVMNAMLAQLGIAEGTKPQDTMVAQNVLSHEGASGKDKEGKKERLFKSYKAIVRLLNSKAKLPAGLADVKKAVIALLTDVTKDAKDEYVPGWRATMGVAKGIDQGALKQTWGTGLNFGVSADLKGAKETLAKTAPYQNLVSAFESFMRQHYGDIDATPAAATDENSGFDRLLKWYPELTWIINKAAADGFQKVLDDYMGHSTKMDIPTILGPNKEATAATSLQHVANLRLLKQNWTGQPRHLLDNTRLDTGKHSRSMALGFDSYEDIAKTVPAKLDALSAPDWALSREEAAKGITVQGKIYQTIQTVLTAKTLDELNTAMGTLVTIRDKLDEKTAEEAVDRAIVQLHSVYTARNIIEMARNPVSGGFGTLLGEQVSTSTQEMIVDFNAMSEKGATSNETLRQDHLRFIFQAVESRDDGATKALLDAASTATSKREKQDLKKQVEQFLDKMNLSS